MEEAGNCAGAQPPSKRATEARATEQASARATPHGIKQAEEMLATAEAQDPAGFVMLTVRGDLAHMRRQGLRRRGEALARNRRGTREEQLVGCMGLATRSASPAISPARRPSCARC